ncbi:MAG: ATP-binding protein, partial [Chitinispirillaceae bacterium]|nr:ATP-binding protein [Chitinispirillaceae bacterium]
AAEKQRMEIENQLRMAQKMEAIGLLAASVAHDFNNFLTAIVASSEIILSLVKGNTEVEYNLEQILKTSKRATELVKHLLAFSRRQPIEPRILNLNELIKEMESMLNKLITKKIKLHTIFEPNLWEVKADPLQIEQVIMNMVVNARDAMPDGGNITIETSNLSIDESFTKHNIEMKVGDYVIITISDTGCGMDEQTMTRIFEPFFTTKEEGKGTGLGLSTAYGIIKKHGGSIKCISELGKGTKFIIYLPRFS